LQISGSLPTDVSNQFWEACHEKKFNRIQSEIDNIVAEGFAATAILQRFLEDTLKDERMDDAQKSIVLIKIAEADKCLCDGADEELQLLNVGAHILAALQKSELP
jgi:replication factor C subunit 2/4